LAVRKLFNNFASAIVHKNGDSHKNMDKFDFFEIKVFDAFIDKFAERYVEQRSAIDHTLLEKAASLNCGLDTDALLSIIKSNSVYVDPVREEGKTPAALKDIYRSDMGELLTTYYFEEKLPEGERYVIPLKNISTRERYDMPGRGLDAIGYRKEADGSFTLLLAEAKVSDQKKTPPSVVDQADDSIYKSQKKHHDDEPMILQRLTEYLRHTASTNDMFAFGCLILLMKEGQKSKYQVTYGCGLVRDYTCSDKDKDFGKMKSNVGEFRPGQVNFEIFSFTNKTISETVDLFYNKVRELTK